MINSIEAKNFESYSDILVALGNRNRNETVWLSKDVTVQLPLSDEMLEWMREVRARCLRGEMHIIEASSNIEIAILAMISYALSKPIVSSAERNSAVAFLTASVTIADAVSRLNVASDDDIIDAYANRSKLTSDLVAAALADFPDRSWSDHWLAVLCATGHVKLELDRLSVVSSGATEASRLSTSTTRTATGR